MSIPLLLSVILGTAGVCLGLTMWAYWKFPERRIREEPERLLKGPKVAIRMGLNSLFSAGLLFAFTYGLSDYLFYTEPPSAWWRIPLEFVGVLAIYDVLYYLLHRYPFHRWGWLKSVHAVHHTARFPIAVDSLYLHPVENFLGLALLTFCIWLVGPISVASFGVCFFVYSWLNIVVHAGIVFPAPFQYFTMLARKHDKHHATMSGGNFASITPLPDLIFGTAE